MRIWHIVFAVFLVALVMGISRDPAGRVAIVVFLVGLFEVLFGLAAIMMLFQTVGAIGEAKGPVEHFQGLLTTAAVVAVASGIMVGALWVSLTLIQRVA